MYILLSVNFKIQKLINQKIELKCVRMLMEKYCFVVSIPNTICYFLKVDIDCLSQ